MLTLLRTNSEHPDFIALVQRLDAYLAEIDGEDHAFYHQFNKIDTLNQVVLVYNGDQALGCGAFKTFEAGVAEIKRMYTLPESRGTGMATKALAALETWAAETGHHTCILETGKKQSDAVYLYQKNGYSVIPNYGQYEGIETSLCFKKQLKNEDWKVKIEELDF